LRVRERNGTRLLRAPAAWDAPAMAGHDFERIEEPQPGRYVLVCSCGWRSAPSDRAKVVSEEWDEHRRVASTEP
jgi:hypothetical protein